MARAMPFISATLMSVNAGCLQAGGSMTYIFQSIAGLFSIDLPHVFLGVATVYTINAGINLVLFTPNVIYNSSTSISLYQNAHIRSKICKSEESKSYEYHEAKTTEKQIEKSSTLDLFKGKDFLLMYKLISYQTDYRLYMMILAVLPWELRKGSHMSWLGAGWPKWVIGREDADFEFELNKLQGLSLLSLMVLNIIPGVVVDAMRQKFAKPYDADYGAALGLSISMTICVTLLVSHQGTIRV